MKPPQQTGSRKEGEKLKNLFKKNQLMITALAVMIAIAGYLQFAGTDLEEKYLTANQTDNISEAGSSGVITENLQAGNLTGSGQEVLSQSELELSEEELASSDLLEIPSLDSEVNGIEENYLQEGMQQAQTQGEQSSELSAQAQPEEDEIPGEAVFTSANGVAVLSEARLLKEQTRAKNKETLLMIINSTTLTEEQKQAAVNNMIEMTAIAEKESAAEILLEAKGFADVVVSINGEMADVVVNALELTDAQRAQIEDIVKRKTGIPAENIVISTVVGWE